MLNLEKKWMQLEIKGVSTNVAWGFKIKSGLSKGN